MEWPDTSLDLYHRAPKLVTERTADEKPPRLQPLLKAKAKPDTNILRIYTEKLALCGREQAFQG